VHWPEAVVSDVFVYDNERPTAPSSFSSRGKWFVNCFVLVVHVVLVFTGEFPSHNAGESTAVAIRTVIPSEMSLFLPRGGMDEQSIGGESYEWWPVAQKALVVVDPVVVATVNDTAIPSETPSS
jgi:hypothetical protein